MLTRLLSSWLTLSFALLAGWVALCYGADAIRRLRGVTRPGPSSETITGATDARPHRPDARRAARPDPVLRPGTRGIVMGRYADTNPDHPHPLRHPTRFVDAPDAESAWDALAHGAA